MIIRIALLLLFAAFAVFLSVDFLLWLTLPGLPRLLTKIGLALLLSAFSILIVNGLFVIIKQTTQTCLDYLSAPNRAHRRLLFIQAKQHQIKQLFFFKKIQINYFNEVNRKKLLIANNHHHLQSLSKAIDNDLRSLKNQLPAANYQAFQHENRLHRKKKDIEALLKLQNKIATSE
jgi:hypothetical protein